MLYFVKNSLSTFIMLYIILINIIIEKLGIKDKIIIFNKDCKKALLI